MSTEIGRETRPATVVVLGGGFAGVACARRLADEPTVEVTLIDQRGTHQFQPLLYQLATAELTPRDVQFDLSDLFRHNPSVTVMTATVTGIDPKGGTVTLADNTLIRWDRLVIAAGAAPNFFHVPGADHYAVPLYSVEDAEQVRGRILDLFGVWDQQSAAQPRNRTVVVAGGGPTGVETAGAIADLIRDVLPHLAHDLATQPSVVLVDRAPSVLRAFSSRAQHYASDELHRRGVTLQLGAAIAEVTDSGVRLDNGSELTAGLVIWAGGEQAASVVARAGLPVGTGGRVDVLDDLTVPGFPTISVVGDAANIGTAQAPLPQLGSVAQQSGDWAAQNILAGLEGLPTAPFDYRDKGIMAMIGRQAAVAEVGEHRHELHGRVAFAAWLGVHAELLSSSGAEINAFVRWAGEFYFRPHHRSAALLAPSEVDKPRIGWNRG